MRSCGGSSPTQYCSTARAGAITRLRFWEWIFWAEAISTNAGRTFWRLSQKILELSEIADCATKTPAKMCIVGQVRRDAHLAWTQWPERDGLVNQPAAVTYPTSGDRRDGGFYGRAVCMRTACPPNAKAGRAQGYRPASRPLFHGNWKGEHCPEHVRRVSACLLYTSIRRRW